MSEMHEPSVCAGLWAVGGTERVMQGSLSIDADDMSPQGFGMPKGSILSEKSATAHDVQTG